MENKSDGPEPSASGFEDLARRAEDLRRAGEAEQRRERAELHPMRRTYRAIHLAAWGRDDEPVGDVLGQQILIEPDRWARFVLRAGRSWKLHPGVEVLDAKPIPGRELGVVAARRIFALAAGTASIPEIADAIRRARQALGPATEPNTGLRDSELGLLEFFRQLSRFYDGMQWTPPRTWTSQRQHQEADADGDARSPRLARQVIPGELGLHEGHRLAAESLAWLASEHPGAGTREKQYALLKDCPAYIGLKLPRFVSWDRYCRDLKAASAALRDEHPDVGA